MKKNQQKVIELPITGRDELNIIECPLTLLTDKAEENQKTLEFTDIQQGITRHWTITGSDKYGLPCALDEPVFIAMLALTKRDGFSDRKISFNPYGMLKLMSWPNNGKNYSRLELALSRLSGVTIYTDYLWDRGKFRECKASFHIIDNFLILKGKKNIKSSYFRWDDEIFKSFLNGNLKDLNLDIYFDLKTPISRRFFRLWDKRLYKRDQISFDLKDLCYEKLGISRNLVYPSLLKQALSPALKEQKVKKLLSSATYIKAKDGSWLLNIKRYRENPEPMPDIPPGSAEAPKDDTLLEKLLLLKIPTNKAKIILETYSRELIEGWIMAVDIVRPVPRNKAGYLTTALKEAWELPEDVRKKKEAEEREREEKLKDEYDDYILAQVDEYLKTMDPEQVEKEIAAHKEVYFSKLPPYFKEDLWESEAIKPQIRIDYKRNKAKVIGLPSFEEWKANNKKVCIL